MSRAYAGAQSRVRVVMLMVGMAMVPCGHAMADSTPQMAGLMSFAHQPIATRAAIGDVPNITALRFDRDLRAAPSFGYSPDRWWAKFSLSDSVDRSFYIRVDAPSSDQIAAYEHCPGRYWHRLPRLAARYAVFEAAPATPACELLVMEESRAVIRFNINLLSIDEVLRADNETLIGLAMGIAIVASGFALFMWYYTRRAEFLHFIFYQLGSEFFILRFWGFIPGVILSHIPWAGGLCGVGGLNLGIAEYIAYIEYSMEIPKTHPTLHRLYGYFLMSALITTLGEVMGGHYQWAATIANLLAAVIYWLTVIVLKWKLHRRRAMQQVLGYTPALINIFLFLASTTGHATLAELRILFLFGQIGSNVALSYWMALEFKQDRDRREKALMDTVTELKTNRAKLEQYQSDLEAIVETRTAELQSALANERAIVAQQRDFTAMIGHEFRTPLAVIDGQARRIARSERAEDDFIRRSREIRDAVHDMVNLMDSLLAQSRYNDSGVRCNFINMPVIEIIQLALRNAVPPERYHDVKIDCPSYLICRADRVMLSSAIGNILNNATKYSDQGSEIHITTVVGIDFIDISVRDFGVGIVLDEITTIFSKFQRGTNVLTTSGTGLGLFLARQVIEAHGGTIDVTSEIGQGTCFTLHLPVADMTAGTRQH